MRQLLNPFRYGLYAIDLFSHKVLRRLVVFPLLILAFMSPFLWYQGLIYQVFTLGQGLFYGLAVVGYFLRNSSIGHQKFLALPLFFCMVYSAALLATLNIVRRRKIVRWEPNRQAVEKSVEKDAMVHSMSEEKKPQEV